MYLGVVVIVVAHVTTGSEAGVGAKPASRVQPSVVDVVALHPLESLTQEPGEGFFVFDQIDASRIYRLSLLRANCEKHKLALFGFHAARRRAKC